jgi:hypothetical protein
VTVVGAILAGGFAVKVCMCKFIEVFLLQGHCNQNASMYLLSLTYVCLFPGTKELGGVVYI